MWTLAISQMCEISIDVCVGVSLWACLTNSEIHANMCTCSRALRRALYARRLNVHKNSHAKFNDSGGVCLVGGGGGKGNFDNIYIRIKAALKRYHAPGAYAKKLFASAHTVMCFHSRSAVAAAAATQNLHSLLIRSRNARRKDRKMLRACGEGCAVQLYAITLVWFSKNLEKTLFDVWHSL